MAQEQQEAFVDKTRKLYLKTFGRALEDHEIISALEAATAKATESFLSCYVHSAGLSLKDLEALKQRSQSCLPPSSSSASSQQQARHLPPTTGTPKFKKSENDEWMFNFED